MMLGRWVGERRGAALSGPRAGRTCAGCHTILGDAAGMRRCRCVSLTYAAPTHLCCCHAMHGGTCRTLGTAAGCRVTEVDVRGAG